MSNAAPAVAVADEATPWCPFLGRYRVVYPSSRCRLTTVLYMQELFQDVSSAPLSSLAGSTVTLSSASCSSASCLSQHHGKPSPSPAIVTMIIFSDFSFLIPKSPNDGDGDGRDSDESVGDVGDYDEEEQQGMARAPCGPWVDGHRGEDTQSRVLRNLVVFEMCQQVCLSWYRKGGRVRHISCFFGPPIPMPKSDKAWNHGSWFDNAAGRVCSSLSAPRFERPTRKSGRERSACSKLVSRLSLENPSWHGVNSTPCS